MTDTTITCNYCQQPARLVGREAIYPRRRDLRGLKFWHCAPCGAWVGCHRGIQKPLGRLADAELREAKREAHVAFDELWRRTTPAGSFDRNGAYRWLARQLGIERSNCHIGMFDVETCRQVVEVCERKVDSLKA